LLGVGDKKNNFRGSKDFTRCKILRVRGFLGKLVKPEDGAMKGVENFPFEVCKKQEQLYWSKGETTDVSGPGGGSVKRETSHRKRDTSNL